MKQKLLRAVEFNKFLFDQLKNGKFEIVFFSLFLLDLCIDIHVNIQC